MHALVPGPGGEDVLADSGKAPPDWYIPFREGELVTIKGGLFRVAAIRGDALMLRPEGKKEKRGRRRGGSR
jgi:hypothetical protein